MRINIAELSEKYNLEERIIVEEIETVVSDFLKLELNIDAECVYDEADNIFKLYGYKHPTYHKVEISLSKMSSQKLKSLVEIIQQRFASLVLTYDLDYYKSIANTLIQGRIISITDNGNIYVEYFDKTKQESVICEYLLQDQPINEIGKYVKGETYIFYVLRVMVEVRNDVPKLILQLSRKSKSFVELLIKNELLKNNYNYINFKTIKRVAGAFTGVLADQKIPKEIIKTISDYLHERIVVKFGNIEKLEKEPIIQENRFWKSNEKLDGLILSKQ